MSACGGCGATKNSERCIGCFHDFGDEESAWVRKYDGSRVPLPKNADEAEAMLRVAMIALDQFAPARLQHMLKANTKAAT